MVVVVVVVLVVVVVTGIPTVVVGSGTVESAAVVLVTTRQAGDWTLVDDPEHPANTSAAVATQLARGSVFTASPFRGSHPGSRAASRATYISLVGVGVPDMGQYVVSRPYLAHVSRVHRSRPCSRCHTSGTSPISVG